MGPGPCLHEDKVSKANLTSLKGRAAALPGVGIGVQDLDDGLLGQLQSKLLQHCPGVAHAASTVAPCLVPATTHQLGHPLCMLPLSDNKRQGRHTACMQAVLKVQRCAQEGEHLGSRQRQLSVTRSGGKAEEEGKDEEERAQVGHNCWGKL